MKNSRNLNSKQRARLQELLEIAQDLGPLVPCHGVDPDPIDPDLAKCHCKGGNCHAQGKHPHWVAGPHGLKHATRDPKTIEKWVESDPKCRMNWAVRLDDLVLVDKDTPNNLAMDELELKLGSIAHTRSHRSGGPGRTHHFFKRPPHLERVTRYPWSPLQVEVKGGAGGYAMVLGTHRSGSDIGELLDLGVTDPAPLPREWELAITAKKPRCTELGWDVVDTGKAPKGERHDRLVRLAARARDGGLGLDDVRACLTGFNLTYCEPPIDDESELDKIAEWAAAIPVGSASLQSAVASAGGQATPKAACPTFGGRDLVDYAGLIPPTIRAQDLWLVDGLVPRGMPAIIAGPPKCAKSILALDLAVAYASGRPWLGADSFDGGRVLALMEEDHELVLRDRIHRLCRAHDTDVQRLRGRLTVDSGTGFRFDDPESFARMCRTLGELRPDLLIVDSLRRCSLADENSSSELAAVTGPWAALCQTFGVTVLVLHHMPKAAWKGRQDASSVRGSGDLHALSRSTVLVSRVDDFDRDQPEVLVESDGNLPGVAKPVFASVRDGVRGGGRTLEVWSESKSERDTRLAHLAGKELRVQVLGLITESENGATQEELRAELGGTRDRIRAVLANLKADGKIGRYGQRWRRNH